MREFPAHGAGGRGSADGAARIRGPFSHVREWPPWTPKRTQGALPLDPAIAGLQLEGLHALRNQVRCTWLRHESSASRYRYQPRLTIVRREWRFLGGRLRTECGIAALAALRSALVDDDYCALLQDGQSGSG